MNDIDRFKDATDCQIKQLIVNWFSLTREQRKKLNYDIVNVTLYHLLLPIFFPDLNLSQIILSNQQLHEKFNRFFTSAFKMKIVQKEQYELYNLKQLFLFSLDDQLSITWLKSQCSNIKNQENPQKIHKFQNLNIDINQIIKTWQKVQKNQKCTNNSIVKIEPLPQNKECKIIYANLNSVMKFRQQIEKEDLALKTTFIRKYVFQDSSSVSIPKNFIQVKTLKRGQTINKINQKLYLIFQGNVIQKSIFRNSTNQESKTYNTNSNAYKFSLVKGTFLCKKVFKSFLMSEQANHQEKKQQGHCEYYVESKSKFLCLKYTDISKMLLGDPNIRKFLLEKLSQVEQIHYQIYNKAQKVKSMVKYSHMTQLQVNYPILRNKKSKAFRRKTNYQQNDYQQFITLEKFERITKSKQNIQKKHIIYAQLNNLLRQKQKQQRFAKKLKTEKGIKQIKKCQYLARLKQAKIQNLAIKDSILNTQKYRDMPNDIKFIFQEQNMDKYIKNRPKSSQKSQKIINKTQANIQLKRHKKKWLSMVDFEFEKNVANANINLQFSKTQKNLVTTVKNRKLKIVRYESSPDLNQLQNANELIQNKQRKQGKMKTSYQQPKQSSQQQFKCKLNNRWI